MIAQVLATVHEMGQGVFGAMWPLVWIMVKIQLVMMPILGIVAYLTLYERRLLGLMHVRLGANRNGPMGLFQPIADGIKAVMKEITWPSQADKPPVFHCARAVDCACAGGVVGDSVRAGTGAGGC